MRNLKPNTLTVMRLIFIFVLTKLSIADGMQTPSTKLAPIQLQAISQEPDRNRTVFFLLQNSNNPDSRIRSAFEVLGDSHNRITNSPSDWSLLGSIDKPIPMLLVDYQKYLDSASLQYALESDIKFKTKIACLILSGKHVSDIHVELATKITELKFLILDSCTFDDDCLERFKKVNKKVKILQSQRLHIQELKKANGFPGRVLLEKIANDIGSFIDDEHFYRIVEINRNREVRTVWGRPISKRLLSRLPFIWSLRSLDLSEAEIDNRTLTQLGRLETLEILRLDKTRIDDQGLRKLKLDSITCLSLSGTDISKELPKMPKLTLLDVSNTKVSADSCCDTKRFPNLQSLIITDTNISTDGLRKCLELKNLRYLTLDDKWSRNSSVLSLEKRGVVIKFVKPSK